MQLGRKMRMEYSIWLLAFVVLFVANGRDGVHHVHGMVANHHRTHHGKFSRLQLLRPRFSHYFIIIFFFSLKNFKAKTRT